MYPCIQYWSSEGFAEDGRKRAPLPPHDRLDGNTGTGTASYKAYARAHIISASGKAEIAGSSDQSFRGDASRWNPEDLLVASASTCHMLWYLHLCSVSDVVVLDYRDEPEGLMIE